MSVFERKPGEDICDSCGTDLSHAPTSRAAIDKERIEELEAEIERLKNALLEADVERFRASAASSREKT